MRTVDVILKKKQGLELTPEEIHYIISGYVNNDIPDYQISALLMAICFKGLNINEQIALTTEILESGEKVNLSKIKGICVDKHSTGGVGDKTTLVVAPIIASCGLKIAKMSGRGLGHTGGTLDKLESIPGFKITISPEDFAKQVNEIGIAVVGQTANITPADKKLYALRDVTGTIESVGLIASSIMSKKLASGAHNILLDVKVGDGAFMKNIDDARVLAKAMVLIGNKCGRNTVAMLTDMDQPLGEAVGNSIEVIEAIETLKGKGPRQFWQLCLEICTEMLLNSKIIQSKEEAIKLIISKIANGEALNKLRQMIVYQGGDPRVIEDYSLLPTAKFIINVCSESDGYVSKINTLDIGNAAMLLGAGRIKKEDSVDLAVGVKILKKVGDLVSKDEKIAIIYSNGVDTEEVKDILNKAFTITKEKVNENKVVLDIVY